MAQFDAAVSRTATTGVPQTHVFKTHVSYPPQLVPIAQPDTKLSSQNTLSYTIQNATTPANTTDKWDGSPITQTTNEISLTPDYQYYQNAQLLQYEYGVTHYSPNENASKTTVVTDKQTLITDNKITLLRTTGEISVVRRHDIVTTLSRTTSPETVTVTNTSNSNITLSLDTSLSESQWREMLASERTENGGHVHNIRFQNRSGNDVIDIVLEQDQSYTINIFEVSINNARVKY
jgi:hypothetical protein